MHTSTWHLLSSMATSLRLTVRSTLGEEKSTSDLGFMRSLASAEIGRKTADQQETNKKIVKLIFINFECMYYVYMT